MIHLFLDSALLLLFMNCIWFVVASFKKDNTLADIAWGLGFVVLSWFAFFEVDVFSWRSLLVCILVSIWGLRLSGHILKRHWGAPEDHRYAKFREDWGKWVVLRSFFQVYLLQGILLLGIVSPVLWIIGSQNPSLGLPDVLGLSLWIFGFLFESIADSQLQSFVKIKKPGQILQTGLWKYSRHPNYFGEVTEWWGLFLICLSTENGIYMIFSPLLISILILFVSGIPLLERKYAGNPEFEAYKAKTSVFFPWPARK